MTVEYVDTSISLEQFVDGVVVHVADSSFPVIVRFSTADAAGVPTDLRVVDETRVMLVREPETDRLAFAVWSKGDGSGPVLDTLEWVVRVSQFDRRSRSVELENGLTAQYGPSRKCGCGTRLRGYNPWGSNVKIQAGPRPVVS